MNTDFLIQLQWYTVLTDWTWTFAHLRNMLCQGPEGTSAPGKPVSPWRQVNVLAIYAESNHEYRLSDPTTVVHSTVWLDLDIILPAEDALPRTRKFINTWKTGFAIKASQCSSHLYWIKPWIQTFWSNCDGTHCWLTPPGHLFTHETWATKKQKAPEHLKNRFCHQRESMFWPFILNQASPDWLHGWTGILVEPVWRCRGLRKCVFIMWSTNMARTLNCLHGETIFSRRWRVLWYLVEHLPQVERCSGLVGQYCVPLQLDQNVCIHGMIHYKWPEHWLSFFQVSRSLLVLDRASSAGEKIFMFSQSVLCTTVVGSESVYSWFDSL